MSSAYRTAALTVLVAALILLGVTGLVYYRMTGLPVLVAW